MMVNGKLYFLVYDFWLYFYFLYVVDLLIKLFVWDELNWIYYMVIFMNEFMFNMFLFCELFIRVFVFVIVFIFDCIKEFCYLLFLFVEVWKFIIM